MEKKKLLTAGLSLAAASCLLLGSLAAYGEAADPSADVREEAAGADMVQEGDGQMSGGNGGEPGSMNGGNGGGPGSMDGGNGGGPGSMDGGNGGGRGRMDGGNGGGPGGMNGRNGGGSEAITDPEILAVLEENAPKFEQFSFTDGATGTTLEYSLYIPQEYNPEEEYPLVMFIPDATGAGKTASQIVQEYYGAAVWAGEEDQERHPSFVLVPAYTGVVTDDDWNASEQLDVTVNLIRSLQENYSIDEDRIYTTGQSMGCMSSLYLNSKYPDLFAASIFVSGQWNISVLNVLEEQSFFYITAGGDAKASGGQDEVMALFDQDQIPYTYGSWDAQADAAAQDANVQALLSEGIPANMIRFETGTVLTEGSSMEHMASFNYAYQLTAVRDWLFEQSREW